MVIVAKWRIELFSELKDRGAASVSGSITMMSLIEVLSK
jgi:hypothetical protein